MGFYWLILNLANFLRLWRHHKGGKITSTRFNDVNKASSAHCECAKERITMSVKKALCAFNINPNKLGQGREMTLHILKAYYSKTYEVKEFIKNRLFHKKSFNFTFLYHSLP